MIEYKVRVYEDRTKIWNLDGKFHREDGPAIEYPDGDKRWYLNGKELTEAEHKVATSKSPCEGKGADH